jgi:hypothetical protein
LTEEAMMSAAPFRPAGPRPASAVLTELARLWEQAAHQAAKHGKQVTQKQLAREARVPLATVNSWATGTSSPRNLDQLSAAGSVLALWAGEPPLTAREWSRLIQADQAIRAAASGASGAPAFGCPLPEVMDPFALGVHRPIEIDESSAGRLPPLPPYVRRDHDVRLDAVVAQTSMGCSAIAVLVGGSSTGKTRACWEAIQRLPRQWRLWHPFAPTWPEAVLAALDQVERYTVVWLNETRHYLLHAGLGERVAAGLRTLLGDPARGPVLVLGTLWPEHWDTLTRTAVPGEPDSHAQARALLTGADIAVPESFGGPELQALQDAAPTDARLAQAVAEAEDGRVTQYLAGVPELLARYRNAPAIARGLIHAAMDAHRIGYGPALPRAFLETAAPGYLTSLEWDNTGEHWLEQALAYTAAPCKGVRGPLSRMRPVPGDREAREAERYRLADYLAQASHDRDGPLPPSTFWKALPRQLDPVSPLAFVALLRRARSSGTPGERVSPLAARAAVSSSIAGPRSIGILLRELHKTGEHEAAAVLGERASRHDYTDTQGVVFLLEDLAEVGHIKTLSKLARRSAASVELSEPRAVAHFLLTLVRLGPGDAVDKLLARDPAAHVGISDPKGIADLELMLREVCAHKAADTLIKRASAKTPEARG